MLKRILSSLFVYFLLTLAVYGQNSIDQLEASVLFDNGKFLMDSKNYAGARAYFEKYLESADNTYRVEVEYYNSLSALKLYHLDGEKLIQQFIAKYPESPQSSMAYIELGDYFFQDRNYKQAITYLKKVDQKNISKTHRSEVQYQLGYSYFATKKFKEALLELNKVKNSTNKFTGPAHYYAAFIEYDQEDYEMALRDYKAIENDKAFSSSIPYMIASIHYKSANFNELIVYTKPIIDNAARVQQKGQMAILLAESYYELGKYTDAYFYFNLANDSEKFTAQTVYHYGLAALNTNNRDKAQSLLKSIAGQQNLVGTMASFELGKSYLEEGNKDFAFTAFKSVMENKSAGAAREEASFISGKLAYDLGRFSECISLMTEFRGNYPQSQYTNVADDILAQAFVNTRNYMPALEYIEKLEVKSETVLQAYQQATFYIGVDYYNDRKFTEAISYFTKSLENPLADAYTLRANLWLGEAYSIGRRYDTALPYYMAAVTIGITPDEDSFYKSIYGRGYAYFNTANYAKALTDFKLFVNKVSKDDIAYGDAVVRLADCYYVIKDYNAAIEYFGDAIRSNINEQDYAYYQAGVIYGILDNTTQAISFLDRVINVYTTSAYYDDALFEKGLILLKEEKYKAAIAVFQKLQNEKPRSPYIAFALERSAVANLNLGNYDQTVKNYKEFIDKYPNNPGVSDALIGLQESMRLNGNLSEFDKILKDFRANNPDISGLEKVEFQSLKGLYNNQQYEQAARGLAGFLSAYPNDFNVFEAKYLLAESLYLLNNADSALNLYSQLYREGGETRIHRIIERLADIEFSNSNWPLANKYYRELATIAVSNNQKLRAWRGLMNGYFELANYDSTLIYVDALLENGGGRSDFVVAATLKKGLTQLNLGQFDNALLNFETTTELAKDKNGAEAQYYIGLILHQMKDYTNSNEALYVIPEQYSMYSEWLDKGFLLVADNFIAMNEYFQAKATLQSIIDNSQDSATVQKATDRFEAVNDLETKAAIVVPDSLNTIEIDTSSNNEQN